MGIPADHRLYFARSLTAIHLGQYSSSQRQSPTSTSNASNDIEAYDSILLKKRDRRGKAIRGQSIRRCSRRCSLDRAATLPFTTYELPPLPFSKKETEQEQRESSQERPVRKFQRRHSTAQTDQLSQEDQCKGFREHYDLGDAIRSPSHMINEPISEQATKAVDVLRKHDFAFVKRSDGSYSYAILAYRSEESMTFVMNGSGSTKMISKRHWSKLIRLVASEV